MMQLQTLELANQIHHTIDSVPEPVGGFIDVVLSTQNMPQLTRLNLRGNDINVTSRRIIMDQPRVKNGTMHLLLSPCLVFLRPNVRFSCQDIKDYIDSGCCVYLAGHDPAYPEEKWCASGLVPVLGEKSVRIQGKGKLDFFGLNSTSTVLGECYCPAGSKGYYELIVGDDSEVSMPSFGFCSKNWANGLKTRVGVDSDSWGITVQENKFFACGADCNFSDSELTLAPGDVIGLGCEINRNEKTDRCQPEWQHWKALSLAKTEDGKHELTASGSISKFFRGLVSVEDQMLSAQDIYEIEPKIWASNTDSSSCLGGGKICVWIHKKTPQKDGCTQPSELGPAFFEFELPAGLDGLCPAFTFDSGLDVRCNLGGKGWEEFHHQPPEYQAMGSFLPPPISPNMNGVFTVLHVPNSLPIASRSPTPSAKDTAS